MRGDAERRLSEERGLAQPAAPRAEPAQGPARKASSAAVPTGPRPFVKALPGNLIPAFSLRSTSNQRIRSADLFGTRLVMAFTGMVGNRSTRGILTQLRTAYPSLVRAGATVLAFAPVAAETGFLVEPDVVVPFPLLRDVAGLVHRKYGAVDWSGQPATSLFITDRSERLIYRALGGLGEDLPSASDVLALLRFDELSPPRPRY